MRRVEKRRFGEMKKSIFVFIGLLVCLLCTVATGIAGVPQMINFQGRLTDAAGCTLSGEFNVRFKICADSSCNTVLWQEDWSTLEGRALQIRGGIFNVLLGSYNRIPDTIFTGQMRWLGMKVEDEEMKPPKPIASVGYAFHSATSDTAKYVLSSIPPDASVSQAKLKTAIGEVSTSGDIFAVLPGGEYGFFRQVKGNFGAWSGLITKGEGHDWGPNYINGLFFRAQSGTVYVRQRYVTASGKDHWIFLLYDKFQEKIISGWEAPDHPSYGQGGDENEMPHPFADYFGQLLPDSLEIVLVDNDIIEELRAKRTKKKGILELITSEYQLDMSKEGKYTPRDISDETGRHWNVERIPDYIKVRRLKRRVLE